MTDALLEIGVEHLPARFIAPALAQMQAKALALLKEWRLDVQSAAAFGTPRRLALHLRGVAGRSRSVEKTVTGPPARLLKDGQGNFTPQASGFARANGVRPEDLEAVPGPKGDVLQARLAVPGESAAAVLAKLLPDLIGGLEFPKNLEWEESRLRFARPIRNLLALYGRKVVGFELAGVRSSGKALGPDVLSKPIPVSEPGAYVKSLRDACVLVSAADRREALERSLDSAARSEGMRLDRDPTLLEETVWLAEFPTAVVGTFDRAFLELPRELLSAVLKRQLKFFPTLDSSGALAPRFVGVRDGRSEGQAEVRSGYERVLEARFNDARFFHQRDLKTRLRDKQERLKGVVFQKRLGTLYDKRERVVELSIWLCGVLWRRGAALDLGSVEAIARLAYADLVTDVVREFPELQAVMGGHYARRDGESERVALGVSEFYRPAAAKAPLPTHLEGAVVSLAGKLDTLAALFVAGLRPSGSEDPFALRRAGMGIVRIVLEKQLPLSLSACAAKAKELVLLRGAELQEAAVPADFDGQIRSFLWARAEAGFLEMGYSGDEVQAVEAGATDDLLRTFKRLAAVHSLRPNPEFVALASAFKRAANILKQAGVDASAPGRGVNRGLITLEAESTLYDALNRVAKTVHEQIAQEDFEAGLRRLVDLKPCVDRFFENVRVMDSDARVKDNRLALLASLVRLFKTVADISRIQSN